jgi:hypothetical protein
MTGCTSYTKCVTAHYASYDPIEVVQYGYGNDGNSDNDHWYFEDLTLNEQQSVTLSASEIRSFEFTVPDNKYYVVETMQAVALVDTVLLISNLTVGSKENDDGGVGYYSLYGFNNQGGRTLTISVRLWDADLSGTFLLQIRRQQAVYYGGDYIDGSINTTSDLNTPYNSFSSTYDSYKATNEGTAHFIETDSRDFRRFNSEIVFFSGHGLTNGGAINFPDDTWFYSSSITGLGKMKNVRLVVWSACYSSLTPSSGIAMTTAATNGGAQSALGFPDTVTVTSARSFTNRLFQNLANGNTVSAAATSAANALIWPWDNCKDYQISGSGSITLANPLFTKSAVAPSTINSSVLAQFSALLASGNYEAVSLDDGGTRYYKTVNGYLTNEVLDVYYNGQSISKISGSIGNTQKIIRPIFTTPSVQIAHSLLQRDRSQTIAECEGSYMVYIADRNEYTPVQIKYWKYTNVVTGAVYSEAVCINLFTGNIIDYSTINTLQAGE